MTREKSASPTKRSHSADAIVVLGGGVDPDGALTGLSCTRVAHAAELFSAGVAPRVILSGRCSLSQRQEPPVTEAAAMADLAEELGVPRAAMLLEEESRDTLGNAYFTRVRLLDPNGWRRIRVVTSDFHLSRAAWVFRKILSLDYDFSFASAFSGLSSQELVARVLAECRISLFLNEWMEAVHEGDDEGIHRLMLHEHPGYSDVPLLSHEEMGRRLDEIAHINEVAGGLSWITPPPGGGRRMGERRGGDRRARRPPSSVSSPSARNSMP